MSLILYLGLRYIQLKIYRESTVNEMYSPQSSTFFVTVESCNDFCTKINIPPLNLPAVAFLDAGKKRILKHRYLACKIKSDGRLEQCVSAKARI